MDAIEVVTATPARRAALAPMLGRAFVGEPMMRWPMGDIGDLADRFTRAFDHFLEAVLDYGVVWEAGAARGAAVWVPPPGFGAWPEHPWSQERIRALADDGGRRYDAFWDWVEADEPAQPVWLLDSIGVEPAEQGRGVGAALVASGLERARAAGVGACLSTGTPRNVAFYERCGFRVAAERDAPDGGPRIWFMRWEPGEIAA